MLQQSLAQRTNSGDSAVDAKTCARPGWRPEKACLDSTADDDGETHQRPRQEDGLDPAGNRSRVRVACGTCLGASQPSLDRLPGASDARPRRQTFYLDAK